MKSTLLTRMPIVIIGIPIMIYLLNEGGMVFSGFVSMITFACLLEFYGLKRKTGSRPNKLTGLFMALSVCFFYIQFPNMNPTNILSSLLLLILLSMIIELFQGHEDPLSNVMITFGGVIYIAGLLASMIALRNWDALNGARFTMAMIFSVWICDTAAYTFGTLWGKKKIIERISPKKTVVGFIGGIIGAFGSIYFMNQAGFIQYTLNEMQLILLTGIIGVGGQLGDFVESMFKRAAGEKDSGMTFSSNTPPVEEDEGL